MSIGYYEFSVNNQERSNFLFGAALFLFVLRWIMGKNDVGFPRNGRLIIAPAAEDGKCAEIESGWGKPTALQAKTEDCTELKSGSAMRSPTTEDGKTYKFLNNGTPGRSSPTDSVRQRIL